MLQERTTANLQRQVSLPATLRGYRESTILARTDGYVAASLERWETQLQAHVVSRQAVEERRSEFQQAEADLAAADANVQRLEHVFGLQRILAPFDGVILRRSVDVGTLVTSGTQELFSLPQTGRLRLTIWVPQVYASDVRPGQPVEVTLEELSGRAFGGTIDTLPTEGSAWLDLRRAAPGASVASEQERGATFDFDAQSGELLAIEDVLSRRQASGSVARRHFRSTAQAAHATPAADQANDGSLGQAMKSRLPMLTTQSGSCQLPSIRQRGSTAAWLETAWHERARVPCFAEEARRRRQLRRGRSGERYRLAKKSGLIREVRPYLDQLDSAGFQLGAAVLQLALKQAGADEGVSPGRRSRRTTRPSLVIVIRHRRQADKDTTSRQSGFAYAEPAAPGRAFVLVTTSR